MKKAKKHKLKIVLVLIYVGLLALLYLVYSIGILHGALSGVNAVIIKENKTMCNFLNVAEEDGYCILSEEAKFNQEIECYFGKFKVRGGKDPTGITRVLMKFRDYTFGSIFLRCYG